VSVRFSRRTSWDHADSALAEAVDQRRRAGLPVLDLTASNPTNCGFTMDAASLLAPLADEASLHYDPQPFGRLPAREAVRRYYAQQELAPSAEHSNELGTGLQLADICLTTSTSEAYSFLFRLLCDPGDEVLIATPSYPLFTYLAGLDDVRLVEYPLLYEHGWQVQPGAVAARVGPRTRAIVLVHPNNPTGHFISNAERIDLERLCVQHGLALIVDEVFLDYAWGPTHSRVTLGNTDDEKPPQTRSFVTGAHPTLTFCLSGLSKVAGLPQMKASWIVLCGPKAAREEARARLEVIADTFLSMNAPIQQAMPIWLAGCGAIQRQIRTRIGENLRALDGLLAQSPNAPVTRLAGEGGWYAVLRVPATRPDEKLAINLLVETGVLVHPGSAFGFAAQGWLVVSLLAPVDLFATAVRRLVMFVSLDGQPGIATG
jgi:alanine-synthesizing transaminase